MLLRRASFLPRLLSLPNMQLFFQPAEQATENSLAIDRWAEVNKTTVALSGSALVNAFSQR